MIVRKACVIMVVMLLVLLVVNPAGKNLLAGDTGPYASIFSDIKARKVGDVVTVEIIEISSARSQARTQTDNEHESSFSNQATGDFDFLPLFNIGSSVSNEYDGEGKTSRQGSLRAKITATIIDKDEAGNYIIEGSRTVQGNLVDFETVISDYKEVGGLMIAHSIEAKPKGAPTSKSFKAASGRCMSPSGSRRGN